MSRLFYQWPEAIPLMDIRTETVTDAFFSGWVARFGTPTTITTDRGAQFESRLWDTLSNQFGIIRNRTMSYHPQSNSMVERFHRQLKDVIMARESPNRGQLPYWQFYSASDQPKRKR